MKIEETPGFRFGPVPLAEAQGRILGHNVAGSDGRTALRKGRALSAEDVALLRDLGRTTIYVADPGPGDVGEDRAALRIAEAALGPGLRIVGPASSRANLVSTLLGVLRVDAGRVGRLNEHDGVTLATLATHSPVHQGQVVATFKIIPFALPEVTVHAAEAIAAEGGPLIQVSGLPQREVSLVLSGSPQARERVTANFEPSLRARVEGLGSRVRSSQYVPLEDEAGEAALADAIRREAEAGAGMILLAGETAIVDRHDIGPRAIERAGGQVACFGVPVDPGNLLLLAYLGAVPIVGAPGCARSPKENVLDRILPRLLVGDRLGRADLVIMGHGGLLEDVPDRPSPRSEIAADPVEGSRLG